LEGAVVFLVVVVVLDFGLVTVFLVVGFFTVEALGFSVSAFFAGAFAGAFLVVEDLGLAVAAFVTLALDAGFVGLVADLVVVADLGLVADLEVGLFCQTKVRQV
jgi:hypothetical protein